MPLNTELLLKVKQHILAEPARLRMDLWLKRGLPGTEMHTMNPGYDEPDAFKLPSCGIVGCIAGWTAVLYAPEDANPESYYVRAENAEELLGINSDIEPFNLFYVDHWPSELMNAYYYYGNTQDQRAQIVGRVIDRYITEYAIKQNECDTL